MFAHRFVPLRRRRRVALWLAVALTPACGGLACPDSLSEVDGVCLDRSDTRDPDDTPPPPVDEPAPEPDPERCDGIDNDLDDQVDELWPELGQPCGSSTGECSPGVYVCSADGASIECDGAIGPSVEVCDGLDNDCDGIEDNGSPEVCNGKDDDCNGLIDDGVLSLNQETFNEHTTVAATGDHFVVARALPNDLRVETYDTTGSRTGYFDDIAKPYPEAAFIDSSARDGRVLVAYGRHEFHVLEARVDAEGIPVIFDVTRLNRGWDQGFVVGLYTPPLHPRVAVSPSRFVGFKDVFTLAMAPILDASDETDGAPIPAASVPIAASFDIAGPYVAWQDGETVRAGWLLDDGAFALLRAVARGTEPALGRREAGPAVAFLQDDAVRLTELHGFSLQCAEGRFCNASIDTEPVPEGFATPIALAYVEATDTWFLAVDDRLLAVGRADGEPVVQQSWKSRVEGESPTRIDVEASGRTVAVVQSSREGDSVLSFVGCF